MSVTATTIDDAKKLVRQLEECVMVLAEDFYHTTGMRIKQIDIAWRQFGHPSITPEEWMITKVNSATDWK